MDNLLKGARPLPSHEEVAIENIDDAEGTALLAALEG
jgi:hypothetical protein